MKMSKTELFEKAQEFFKEMVSEDAIDREMEEAWDEAMAKAEDILTGTADNMYI